MKKYILLGIMAVLLVGCASSEDVPSEKSVFQDLYVVMQEDPDAAVAECDTFSEELKQTCYGTYLSLKAEKGETLADGAVCDKITDQRISDGCKLMVQT